MKSLILIIIFSLFLIENAGATTYEVVEQCFDGVKNYDETAVDCGGKNCAYWCIGFIIEQCTDLFQNYDETGIDCGGDCNSCADGGGAPVVSEPSVNETKTITAKAGDIITINFTNATGIGEIEIRVMAELGNLTITVSNFDGIPEQVSVQKQGLVYRYFQILSSKNLSGSVENITLTFFVRLAWIIENDLSANDITLYRFNESSRLWETITTSVNSVDDQYFYYSSQLTSFSYFAIAPTDVVSATIIRERIVETIKTPKWFLWMFLVSSLINIVLVAIIFWMRNKKLLPLPH